VFCQNYQKIAKTLVSTTQGGPSVEQLANRVVHVSVQLYSNKHLAEKMVKEQNLLHVMVKVLNDMIKPSLQPFQRGTCTCILIFKEYATAIVSTLYILGQNIVRVVERRLRGVFECFSDFLSALQLPECL
jgi:hypothetical protein